jgi:hypothetical protein
MEDTHMDLPDLAERINQHIDSAPSPEELVHGVRAAVSDAIGRDCFVQRCVEQMTARAEACIARGGPYRPLYIDDDRHWRMVIFLWPASMANEPHQHNTWSVSGVMHNCLEVSLYEKNDHDGDLRLTRRFVAARGETGYLVPPCIHALGNPHKTAPTVTLHVFNDSEETDDRPGDTLWLGEHDPRLVARDPIVRMRRELRAGLLLLKAGAEAPSEELLERLFSVGDVHIRLETYKLMVRHRAGCVRRSGDRLLEMLTGSDRERFTVLHRNVSDGLRAIG